MEKSQYSEAGLLELIDALPLAVAVITQEAKVGLVNKMVQGFVGKNAEELIGQTGGEAFGCKFRNDVPEGCGFGPQCTRCELRKNVLATLEDKQERFMVEVPFTFEGDVEKILRISTKPITIDGKEGVLLSIEDITEVKRQEKDRLKANELEATLRVTGAVTHELAQPLMVVLGYADMLRDDVGEEGKEQLEYLYESALKMKNIAHKLQNIFEVKTKKYLSGEILDIDASSDREVIYDAR